ncbi:MAG: retropepsin-like aspartic protease [Candidatus Micrarchaeota archaeon]|nr:retropepsin-like aspartic protease [Candidatus Micrarchaeota archaeon]
MRFKYRSIERPQPLGPKACPMIPVRFTGPAGAFDTAALVDSGADFSTIFEEHAKILGIDLEKLEETDVSGIGGSSKARKGRVAIEIKGKGEHQAFRLDVPCMILKKHAENFPILLGRAGFFDEFEVTFKEKDKSISLKPEH